MELLHQGVILRIGRMNPSQILIKKISQWKHSKYNKGRQSFKALRGAEQNCGDQK